MTDKELFLYKIFICKLFEKLARKDVI